MNRFLTFFFLAAAFSGHSQIVSHFASIPYPDDIKIDRHNNIWVNYASNANADTSRLLRISPEGFVFTIIETTDELGPFGVNDSIIWISSPAAGKVFKYNYSGVRLDSVNVSSPAEIILDPDGTWYLSQDASARILKYTPDNVQHILTSGIPLDDNRSLARDENGLLYTCNLYNADVIRVNPVTGMKTVISTLPTANPASVGYMTYNSGYLYIASGLNCIYKLDTAGMGYSVVAGIEGLAGNYGGNAATSLFDNPKGVAFTVTGDTLFVSDANNHEIRRIAGLNSVGINELQKNSAELTVFPNPVAEKVIISAEDDKVLSAVVTDQNGRAVSVVAVVSGNGLEVNVSKLPDGVYFIQVSTQKGKIGHSRFVKAD